MENEKEGEVTLYSSMILKYDRLTISYTVLKKMKTTSNKDFAYAMTPLKFLSWPLGTWPLQVFNTFSIIRAMFSTFFVV